jgi:hypothetical protein
MIEEIGDISKKIHSEIKATEDPLPSQNDKDKIKELHHTIYEMEVLEKHIKEENKPLKNTIAKLQKKTKGFDNERKLLIKEAEKWYGRTQEERVCNQTMRKKIKELKQKNQGSSYGLEALLEALEHV